MARATRTEPYGTNDKGQPICYAKTRAGGRCAQTRIDPVNFRCRMHGGTATRGLANPNTKSGMYSRDLPTRLLGRYEEVLTDPALLSVRNDIAVLQAEIGDRFARIQQGEVVRDFERILGMTEKIAADWQTWDYTRVDAEMKALREALSGEVNEERAMRDVLRLIDQKAGLVAQENRLLESRDRTMPIEQVALLVRALTTAMRRTINDPDLLIAVDAEFRRITGRST